MESFFNVQLETLIKMTRLQVRSSHRRCSGKKVFLEISQNSKENNCVRASFLIKLQAKACNFIKKETLAQVFSCKFCKISKNTFFIEHLSVAAFGKCFPVNLSRFKYPYINYNYSLLFQKQPPEVFCKEISS